MGFNPTLPKSGERANDSGVLSLTRIIVKPLLMLVDGTLAP